MSVAQRKYSLEEMDDMRSSLLETMSAWDVCGPQSAVGTTPSKDAIEARLRTLMMNGTEPQELRDAAYRSASARQREMDAWKK